MPETDEVSPITPADRRGAPALWTASNQEKPDLENGTLIHQDQDNVSHEESAIKRKPIPMLQSESKDIPEEKLVEALLKRKEMPPSRWRGMIVVIFILAMINGERLEQAQQHSLADNIIGYDLSNTANIQATIYEAMGHIEIFSWITLGYCVGIAAVVPLARRLSEIFDIRAMMIASIVVFMVGVAVTGSASNIGAVIAGRALNGVGAAGVIHM